MEKLFKSIINDAVKLEASDIHFIPVIADKVIIQMRINGDNNHYDLSMDSKLYSRLLIYMKFISHLDVSERNKAQSGQYLYEHEISYYLRISTIPISLGIESCAIRITPQYFSERGFSKDDLDFKKIRNEIYNAEGLFLFTGPTGSGKSTLMYELMHDLKKVKNKHIITIEDPVEQTLDGIVQVSVNEKANISYNQSFKAILRCDPDVIMIGEIRDKETAKQVIQASLSGHLVLSTMHAKNNIGAIHRLIELGITTEQIKQGISCIANQRLVKQNDSSRSRVMTYLFNDDIVKYMVCDFNE
ncbi:MULTISPECIES: competence type IV pilus ATPase ComGA [Mammaliicoccus]|uniref:Flp pilus assembly complex ATPase component TadA n=1 Tax=Mammaliicoccus fleurettii TaxID=150056 RepID=A0ABS5MKJ1_9STAP|nr:MULTISPECIES: competence type IV pilus ATPase ComGA [Mammaliicoccus]HCN60465.1 competence protein ComGA [Staphylococcus sp.]MBL0846201.1 Flp pilus assembly complex ATPase component TadA [Mammaliicoccus fleurettii]MBS3671198.1 Flp pilus assembly complex ATPase component TadA [Mammaliicoccus fleurettii]MBS3696428.1 Flp pilus assembly complex ATPase component TadA [Mammaliicoccus fleurettii]MBW0764107.1 Flp pilus assembly complex ATPase component TadA [Mammaliicoccus fleurettii]